MSKKPKLWSIFLAVTVILSLLVTFSFIGCKKAGEATAPTEEEVATEAPSEEDVAEEAPLAEEEEVDIAALYTYENLREMAKAGAYEGEPAKGHTLAFANILAGDEFCDKVENSIKDQWILAGGTEKDLTILDNKVDIGIAVQNADIVFSKNPEVFIQFQFDVKTNEMIGRKARDLGVFIICVDIPVSGFSFKGVDNYDCGVKIGKWAADQIDETYGGWENVDRVLVCQAPEYGETVILRVMGSADLFKERFGDEADMDKEGSKMLLLDVGVLEDTAKEAFSNYFAANPDDKNIIVFSITPDIIVAFKAAADLANRWDPDKFLITTNNLPDNLVCMLREGITDCHLQYFPEKYGEVVVPGAMAYMWGNPVPSHMFAITELITRENVDEYFTE